MQSHKWPSFFPSIPPSIRIQLSLVVSVLGLLVLVLHPFSQTRAHDVVQRIPRMPIISAATLEQAALGSEVMLEGQIWEGSPLQFRSFVAYVREEFVAKRGWRVRDRATPPLMVTVPDGQVRVVNNNYRLLPRTLPVEWRPDFQRFTPSKQYRALIIGSRVVIFGTVTKDQQGRAITAEYVAGGSRLTLPEAIRHEF